MKVKFYYLLALSAFILSVTAAYFSVTGLARLFNGAYWSVIIMASGLEFAKLVSLSFLYRYWEDISRLFRMYLLFGVFVLMVITSAGIYGFLSFAYSVTADKLSGINNGSQFLENKKSIFLLSNTQIGSIIKNKSDRIRALTALRSNQEARIDTLYKKNMLSGVKRTEKIIKEANVEIEKLTVNIDEFNKSIQVNMDSISCVDIAIIKLKDNDVNGEIGPLKYISILTGKSINSVVNFFILLLIFVFDPLAIAMVIATNKVMVSEKFGKKCVNFEEMYAFLDKNPNKRPSDYKN